MGLLDFLFGSFIAADVIFDHKHKQPHNIESFDIGDSPFNDEYDDDYIDDGLVGTDDYLGDGLDSNGSDDIDDYGSF